MTSQIVINSLNSAIVNRKPAAGLTFHSDRGSQYASEGFRKELKIHGTVQSISGKGNCYDNTVAESFLHTLKTEFIFWNRYKTGNEAKSSIFYFIEIFYNRRRRHSFLNYFSTFDFEFLYFTHIALHFVRFYGGRSYINNLPKLNSNRISTVYPK